MNKIDWVTGLENFRENSLTIHENIVIYSTQFLENDFEPDRNIDDIFFDHLKNRESKVVELLYSGGMDSQLVLESCVKNKIPVEAMTMVIKINGAIVNVSDLYYAEKYCRENNIKQNFFYLDALEFYESEKYLEYIEPYYISEPHVASHFWLIEQCQSYPVIAGDWPWVQTHLKNKVLSPYKLSFSSYERFMRDRGIYGIGDFISHSFESVYRFIKLHIDNKDYSDGRFHHTPFIKQKVYGLKEPRIKSYGWEDCPDTIFNIRNYLPKSFNNKKFIFNIKWGQQIKQLMNTNINSNNRF